MNVILSENIDGLGKMGDSVRVAPGYARNFLFPKKLAVEANSRNLKNIEHVKRAIESKVKKLKLVAEEKADTISKLLLEFSVRAGEEGKLFGSVTSKDIHTALAEKGFEVDKKKIVLEKPIKELGTFFVPVKIQHDVTASLKIEVKPSEDSHPVKADSASDDEAKTEEVTEP